MIFAWCVCFSSFFLLPRCFGFLDFFMSVRVVLGGPKACKEKENNKSRERASFLLIFALISVSMLCTFAWMNVCAASKILNPLLYFLLFLFCCRFSIISVFKSTDFPFLWRDVLVFVLSKNDGLPLSHASSKRRVYLGSRSNKFRRGNVIFFLVLSFVMCFCLLQCRVGSSVVGVRSGACLFFLPSRNQ